MTAKLLPRDPTPEMIEAGATANPTEWNEGTDFTFASDVSHEVYRAMWDAAPSPPAAEPVADDVDTRWDAACAAAEQEWLAGDERRDSRLAFRDAIRSALAILALPDAASIRAEARKAALEEAARTAALDVDWSQFGKRDIEPWVNGPDSVRDYRIGIASGRSIASAIRALIDQPARRQEGNEMATVTLLPSAAVDRICHAEQMIIWTSGLSGALNLGGFLREDVSYDEVVDLHHLLEEEIRSIITMALDHPEARTVYKLPPAGGENG